MYVPGKGYHVFAGKDASRALGKSSLKVEDCVADYSGLTEDEMKTLDKWEGHYRVGNLLIIIPHMIQHAHSHSTEKVQHRWEGCR